MSLLVRAFAANPMHRRVFGAPGPKALRRNEAFFRFIVARFRGERVAVFENDRLVGLAQWVWSSGEPSTFVNRVKAALKMTPVVGLNLLRVALWSSAWTRHNIPGPQWRLGPLAVDADARNRGIGPLLVRTFCEHVDATGQAGTLQTDRPDYVGFYETCGFEIVEKFRALGVDTWLMQREPAVAARPIDSPPLVATASAPPFVAAASAPPWASAPPAAATPVGAGRGERPGPASR